MDTMSAFARGQASRGNERRVFDWDKAAKLLKESGVEEASAGLSQDWGYTGGRILSDGKPDTESYTYLASTWATPELDIDGDVIDCFIMENEAKKRWKGDLAHLKWPESAVKIFFGEKEDG